MGELENRLAREQRAADVESEMLTEERNVARRSLEALTRELRELHNEVDCRIEHGAESGGHLEYVRDRLRAVIR